ncbi:glycosyltransferase family 2 protein [Ekhidna sp.]|uniref:glycosyltransferase n=1 Tax=Ekhidna sp. TaxID=2608089 RepID=UPI003511A5FD
MPTFSIIIPVYNRPDEIMELLDSLCQQTNTDFEIIVIEDGSNLTCAKVVEDYASKLNISYHFKENSGQGFSRNYGAVDAKGDWLVFFDSDCVIPERYIENLSKLIEVENFKAFTGPDAARNDFSSLQKAISYSMTSFLTTGGIRGKKVKVDKEAHLRSYNLVILKDVFQELGGFRKTNMGEDMELSHRFGKSGYKALVTDEIKVFHKRRNTLWSFFKQVFSFGRTRIQLNRVYRIPIKIPHLLPASFTLGFVFTVLLTSFIPSIGLVFLSVYGAYFLMILFHSTVSMRSLVAGFLAVITTFVQHLGYGLGFIKEVLIPSKP